MKRKYGIDRVAVRLVKEPPLFSEEEIHTPEDAVKVLGDVFRDYDREVVGVVHLRGDGAPINMTIISMGTLNQSLVHPREVLKGAFLSNAASILLFHNHPSGSLNPSREDIELTCRMQQICMLAGIPVVDHIILGRGSSYYSFREKEILPVNEIHYSSSLDDIDLKVAEKNAGEYRDVNADAHRRTTGCEKRVPGQKANPGKKSIKETLSENRKKIAENENASPQAKNREVMIG